MLAFKGAAPNGNDGILITSTSGNQVPQTNVISGNINNGIEIGGNAYGVTVDPNIVGLNTVGNTLLPNGGDGLLIDGNAHDNIIGGHQLSVIPQNTFSGNDGYGIAIVGNAHNNWVLNSFVGTSATGTQALGNQLGGILIGDTANNNKIGDVPSPPTIPNRELISANNGNGITLEDGTSFSTILNNVIGLSRIGDPLPNIGVPIATNASTNNTIQGNQTFACFAAGTRIATPAGELAVELLSAGDLVRTLDGRAAPIRWVGQRCVDCRRHAEPAKVWPVRIAAHAFGDNRPMRDLFLSPDHAVYANDVLIPVKYLINGTTVVQTKVATVHYFHIELDRHDVILAEGLPAESYLDTGDRASFANGGEAIALYPVWGRPETVLVGDALGYAPLRVTGAQVDEVRALLAARADELSRSPRRTAPASGSYSRRAGNRYHRRYAGAAG